MLELYREKMKKNYIPWFLLLVIVCVTTSIGCAVQSCIVTTNRSFVKASAAIVIHWRDINMNDLPTKQDHNKIALFNMENPRASYPQIFPELQPLLDWAGSYRKDSDIFVPYGSVKRKGAEDLTQLTAWNDTNFHSKRLVAWMVSNCGASSLRGEIVKELASYGVEIDEYGSCSGNMSLKKSTTGEAYAYLAERYKFYFPFENTLCRDYATEKLFYPLQNGMVPIVLGGADYKGTLPPNSYIDVLEFPTTKELADYLKRVGNSEILYGKYQEWRKDYHAQVHDVVNVFFCALCEKLHQPADAGIRRENNFLKWWNEEKDCINPVARKGKFDLSETLKKRNTMYQQ